MMKTQKLLSTDSPGRFHDINAKAAGMKPASTKVKINTDDHPEKLFNEYDSALSVEETEVFNRLQEVWGDDKDGAYQTLFHYHENLNTKSI